MLSHRLTFSLDLRQKLAFATELRDSIELYCQGDAYRSFLQKFIPLFLKLLDGDPVFLSTSPDQRLRLCILEILHRLPMTPPELIEPYAPQVVDKLMELARVENEDNAVLCLKTIMDFLRHQPKVLGDRVQPFLNLIKEMFEIMEQAVKDTFDNPSMKPPQNPALAVVSTPSNTSTQSPGSPLALASSEVGGEPQLVRTLQRGMESFKVLAECPIIVVSVFQAYRRVVQENVKSFVPLIKEILQLQAKAQEKAHAEAAAMDTIHTGVCKEIKNRAAFGDFITAQVKTMSFLAYLLRVYSQQLTDFLPHLPAIVVRMLRDIPRERSGTRKELLVAIRHIINFNFRKIFLKKIDELLDERTLIGDGLTVYETMRPLAYSMLADLIHHLREHLSKEQIRRTIEVYTKNLHDDFPGTSFQTMSAKLLMNMAECIAKLEPKEEARHFLIMILNAIGDKFAAMNRQYDNARKVSAKNSTPSIEIEAENYLAEKDKKPDWDEIDIFTAAPIKTANPRERGSDPIADNKFLFKNLLHGLKSLFYQLKQTSPASIRDEIDPTIAPATWNDVSCGYTSEEVNVLIKLFREGARVFRYYGSDKPANDSQNLSQGELLASQHLMSVMSNGKEEKDLLESLATVFHQIDPATFYEVFQSEIPHLYEMMFEHPQLLHIAQFLLASEGTSSAFASMLLQFLMGKIDEVGTADTQKSTVILRLFKLSFMAVTLFAAQNEQILLPHVTDIVTKSIHLSTTAEKPMNYFLLLRSLFRSIGGGKFEQLYKEILPLLEMLLEVLNNLLMSAREPADRDLFVELSLTVPARLSNLLPHLSYLMKPLVVALGAGSDLVGQGLRTLELCVDNLTADYLDPIMAPVIEDLMAALHSHLKPQPYPHFHSHTTMRILGKLGGRNRKWITGPPDLTFKPYADDEASLNIKLVGGAKERPFPSTIGTEAAIAKLMETPRTPNSKSSMPYYKRQAYKLIVAQTKLVVGFDKLPDDFLQLVRLQADDLLAGKFDAGEELIAHSDRNKSIPKRDAQQKTLRLLLKACILSTSVPEVSAEATAFVNDLARHFTILELGRALADVKHRLRPFDVNAGEGPLSIESRVIAEAIGDSLSSAIPEVREAAEKVIMTMKDAAAILFGSAEKAEKLPFFTSLARTFIHNCHEEEWFTKAGGTLGIDILINKLNFGDAWFIDRQIDFARALMYVMKDLPQDVTAKARVQAEATLEVLIKRCNKNASKQDMTNPKTKLYDLCGFLITELAHMNKHVRSAAQKTFSMISQAIGAEVHDLMLPVKDRLTMPIFAKPLRALPFGLQIGYIDAITFCLKTGHNVVEHDDKLMRLIMETLALADADDDNLATKPNEHRNAESITNLRVACIRLLTQAQGFPDFGNAPPGQTKARIIAVLFKSLYMKSPKVVEAANVGLQGVLAQTSKLPKDLLQSGLRPVLMNLQDARKLTVDGLEGLARLLKLLTNYFKVEIGQRLLDHMKTLADKPVLQRFSFTLIEQQKPMRIITAIFNVFHLLPSAAISFLSALVDKVLELEGDLRRTQSSPFRAPLLKYLNHYAEQSWEHFAPRIRNRSHGRFFAQLLEDESSENLRKIVARDASILIKNFTFEGDENERRAAAINAIHVVTSMAKFSPQEPKIKEFLASSELRKALMDVGKSLHAALKQNKLDQSLQLAAHQAGEQVMAIFATHLSQNSSDLDFFFDVVSTVAASELTSRPDLFQFIYKHMITSDSLEYWRTLVTRCIDMYASSNTAQWTKTFIFHNVVNPIIAEDAMRNWDTLIGTESKGTKLVDKSLIEAMLNKLWLPQSATDLGEETGQPGVDASRMELLQTTALLLKYHTKLMQDFRKEIIKFGWHFIKLEDVINKHAAYVVTAYFIAHYETPPKIAIPVYNTLLKAHQNEGRALVTQALELLAPVLRKRLADNKQALGLPMWARVPKKILTEDSSNIQQLMSIFNFLVRHPDLFYEAREPLSLIIIPSLAKVAALPNPSNDSKKTAVNLIRLILQWELKGRQDGSPVASKRRADGTLVTPSPTPKPFIANVGMRRILIKYLVTFISSVQERYPVRSTKLRESFQSNPGQPSQPAEACRKAVGLLRGLLTIWTDVDVDALFPTITEPVLKGDPPSEEKPEMWLTRIINTLQVVKVIVDVKSDEWVLGRLPALQELLQQSMRKENAEVQDCLHSVEDQEGSENMQPLMKRILSVVPDATPEEDADDTPGSEFLTSYSAMAAELLSNGSIICAINMLHTVSSRKPEEIDASTPTLLKVFSGKLTKDHFAATTSNNPQQFPGGVRPENAPAPPDQFEAAIHVDLILKSIDILAARISQLGDSRRPFLSALAALVERSQNSDVCMKVLDLIEHWVFNLGEQLPTLKEKTAVLIKMLAFENRTDTTLMARFLEVVIRIYEDKKITRSELTVRMEQAFLIGTRAADVDLRNRFMTIFDQSISRTASNRLAYVITSQDWTTLADSFWLAQVNQLLIGSIEINHAAQLHNEDFTTIKASKLFSTYSKDSRVGTVMVDDKLESFMLNHRRFCIQLGDVKARDVMEPLGQLQHTESTLAHQVWVALFPVFWSALSRDERADMEKGLLALLTKDYHTRGLDKRPNCVQSLLEGIARPKGETRVRFPPHVMKYLARTYNAWYTAANYMESAAIDPIVDTALVRESNLDALLEIYSALQEDDLFYGTWRRRCHYVETNAALSYEQNGCWSQAQQLYETAQIKARTGALPFSQGEYTLWEDHWVLCAQKLQQWEILNDFAKHENFNDLYLEASWRNIELWSDANNRDTLDQLIKSVSDAPTPRRMFFQAFMSLLKLHYKTETPAEFTRVCDEAVQLSIRKWHQLPKRFTQAHIPILQNFQNMVELHDASAISNSLHQTTAQNLDVKSQELKLMMTGWRERLPNFWDDINAWQDLVTWRQHIFQLINNTYLQLLPQPNTNTTTSSFAYRGYHETAWIINRFAHVARKHNLPEVCISQLSRIYTLPNIEIQEAFLKLREQAKCHYQNPTELQSGLDVIMNTNLNYFGPQQKAEFFTLKGMFQHKLSMISEAGESFGIALYYDIKLPKAWAQWGFHNDRLFKIDPTNLEMAKNAISCYLEAASQYRNAKSRKLFGRILWLLSLDNPELILQGAYNEFKGEMPVWYWITYIPQLLASLKRPEGPIARQILGKLAKAYPQALFFHLRTSKEDMQAIKKQAEAREKQAEAKARLSQGGQQGSPDAKQSTPSSRPATANGEAQASATANGETPQNSSTTNAAGTTTTPKVEPGETQATPNGSAPSAPPASPKRPWIYTEEIQQSLKTAFPLLSLTMETMVDQMLKHLKPPQDEDAQRLIVALLNDALTYVGRKPQEYAHNIKLPATTEANIDRFAATILPPHIRKSFDKDFITNRPTMQEYIQKLRKWRDRFEERLDRRNPVQYLETLSPHLSEFKYQKSDEVEVPGQYLLHRDKNQDFIRIERFMSEIELVRGTNACYRRFRIRGHDGSIHTFAFQSPTPRHSRREERVSQLFRIFNTILLKQKESRRRNLQFNLPTMLPLSPSVRLVQDDPSYVTLQGVYEDWCRRVNVEKDKPIMFTFEKLSAFGSVVSTSPRYMQCSPLTLFQRNPEMYQQVRLETFAAIQENFVPNTIALEYFQATYPSFDDFWLFRRSFSYQLAALTFMTYIMYLNTRYPHKLWISRKTGKIFGTEALPSMAATKPIFHSPEPVPFRLTPNIQMLIGPLATEGIFAPAIMAIARCLTEPESEMEMQLAIFVRDEMTFWFTQSRQSTVTDGQLRDSVQLNSDHIVKRAESLAATPSVNNLPANQTVVDLIANAVNPHKLALTDPLWMGYL